MRSSLTPAEAAFVQRQQVARLATVSGSGALHLVPACFAFDGTRFYTPLDEKPKRVPDDRLQRVQNIQHHPQVALLVDQYDEDWSRLGFVLVRGRAQIVRPEEPTHGRALALLRERYPQYRKMKLEARSIIAIEPERVTSWGPAVAE